MMRTAKEYLLTLILPICLYGQKLPTSESNMVHSARARYYNLEASGFQGMKCSVDFDPSTLPRGLSGEFDLLSKTNVSMELDDKGRVFVKHSYANNTTDSEQRRATPLVNLMTSLVNGLFQTWPTKGLQGPIPPFDSQIESVANDAQGYTLALRVPGSPVKIVLDRDYNVEEIASINNKIVEHPTYTPSASGLVFTGNQANDNSNPSGPVKVTYQLGLGLVDGLRVPISAHLQVNDSLDVKFSLSNCSTRKATVVKVAP